MAKHPGITMHKLTFGGGFIGLLFSVGCSLIFVLGFPTLWYFVALSAGLGLAIAALLRVSIQHRSDRMKPISILSPVEKRESPSIEKNGRGLKFSPAQSFAR